VTCCERFSDPIILWRRAINNAPELTRIDCLRSQHNSRPGCFRVRAFSSYLRRDLSATPSLPPHGRSHPHRMCDLVAGFMSDGCHGHPSRYTLPLSPPPPLSPSSPPPLFPSPSPPLLIGQTLSSHLLCGCVVSGGAFPPPIVRSVSPAPRSHASSLQSCAFLLHPPPPPSTCAEYFLLHDHGTAAFPSFCPHVM